MNFFQINRLFHNIIKYIKIIYIYHNNKVTVFFYIENCIFYYYFLFFKSDVYIHICIRAKLSRYLLI